MHKMNIQENGVIGQTKVKEYINNFVDANLNQAVCINVKQKKGEYRLTSFCEELEQFLF